MHDLVFCIQRFTRMLTEIEVKCMDVYQNENASSKYTSQRANATMSVSGNIVVLAHVFAKLF